MGCGSSAEAFQSSPSEYNYTKGEQQTYEQPAVYTQDQVLPAADPNQNAEVQRLTYKEMYSIREISEHNTLKTFCDLFPWKRGVHSTAIFKEDIKEDFLEMENERLEKEIEMYGSTEYYSHQKLNFSENWGTTPIAVFMERGLTFIKIKACINNSKVADLRVYNDKEYSNDISVDARAIENDLENDNNITVYQTEYLEVLERFFLRLNENLGVIPMHSKAPDGDPNLASFPLPDSVSKDTTVLRQWIVDWVLFETEIDGEAAWEVIPQDIVKNDTTTPEQDAIWEKREQRTDLNDPERMLKRRQEIANYFIVKRADGLPTYCDDYMGFAENLERAWEKFQELCQTD